jgi:hypothetical protein
MSVSKSSDTKDVSLDSEGKFVLTCPGCAKRFQLLDKAVLGKRVTCKACKAPFVVDGSVLTEFKTVDLPKPKPPREDIHNVPSTGLDDSEPAVKTEKQIEPKPPNRLYLYSLLSVSVALIVCFLGLFLWGWYSFSNSMDNAAIRMKNVVNDAATGVDIGVDENPALDSSGQKAEELSEKPLGLQESFLLNVLEQSQPPIQFKITSAEGDMRLYTDSSKRIILACIGNPDNLTQVMLSAKNVSLLEEPTPNYLPEVERFERCIGLIAMSIQGSTVTETKQFLANNIVNALMKGKSESTVIRGIRVIISHIESDHGFMVSFGFSRAE